VRLYHPTAQAEAILRDGFRDGPTSYSKGGELVRGVWLANRVVAPADFSVGSTCWP
jgi:hypothetical protein